MSDIRLATAIIHAEWAPERMGMVRDLQRAVGPPCPVLVDHDQGGKVGRGIWPMTQHGLLRLLSDSSPTHLLLLSDDFQAAEPFRTLVTGAIEARPNDILVLYHGRIKLAEEARSAHKHWITAPAMVYGGCIVFPRLLASAFLTWTSHHHATIDKMLTKQLEDSRLAAWMVCRGLMPYVTAPSLLHHLQPNTSVIRHGTTNFMVKGRQTAWFEPFPDQIDWSQGLANPIVGPASIGPRTKRVIETLKGK